MKAYIIKYIGKLNKLDLIKYTAKCLSSVQDRYCFYYAYAMNSAAAAAAKSLQSCPTLCDPIDGSPPGSPVPEILQARTLEWVAISFSNAMNSKYS